MLGLGRLKLVGVAAVVLLAVVGGGFAVGVFGTPTVSSVDNHFESVSTNSTAVHTDLTVRNPNPIGVQLGGTGVNYTVAMNDVPIASGDRQGLGLKRGNTTIPVSTTMDNSQIPPWWVTHIDNGETTQVQIDATITSSLLGNRSVSIQQSQTVETDIIGQFNSTETRPVNASQPFVSDPVLYVNETRGSWDQAGLTDAETPMDLDFEVYNPKLYPYTVTQVGYEITMNGVPVGEGQTESGYVIPAKGTETIEADAAIQNRNLDDWWVTHLQRNQQTEVYIDFYFVVEGGGEQFRIDSEAIDYATDIETDIFGNKAEYPTGTSESDDGTGSANETESEERTSTPTETADETSTPTETATDSPTETETDDGLVGL